MVLIGPLLGVVNSPVRQRRPTIYFPHPKGEGKRSDLQMTLDTTDLLLKHTMPESSLELSRSGRGGSDAHSILTSSNDDLAGARGGNEVRLISRDVMTYSGDHRRGRTYGREGVMQALLRGVSVVKVFNT